MHDLSPPWWWCCCKAATAWRMKRADSDCFNGKARACGRRKICEQRPLPTTAAAGMLPQCPPPCSGRQRGTATYPPCPPHSCVQPRHVINVRMAAQLTSEPVIETWSRAGSDPTRRCSLSPREHPSGGSRRMHPARSKSMFGPGAGRHGTNSRTCSGPVMEIDSEAPGRDSEAGVMIWLWSCGRSFVSDGRRLHIAGPGQLACPRHSTAAPVGLRRRTPDGSWTDSAEAETLRTRAAGRRVEPRAKMRRSMESAVGHGRRHARPACCAVTGWGLGPADVAPWFAPEERKSEARTRIVPPSCYSRSSWVTAGRWA